jgi:hypothetical protein
MSVTVADPGGAVPQTLKSDQLDVDPVPVPEYPLEEEWKDATRWMDPKAQRASHPADSS